MGTERVKITDASNEVSYANLPMGDTVLLANRLTSITALEGVIIGTRGQANFVLNTEDAIDDISIPANAYAQRELKWLVRYQDDVNGESGSFEIPCPNLTLRAVGTDFADLTNAAVIAFAAYVNTYGVSRDGNAITMVSMEVVGRNL